MKTSAFCVFRLAAALFVSFSLLASFGGTWVSAREINASRMALERRYATAHSLGDSYVFDPRDGWEAVNTSSLFYQYSTPRADTVNHLHGTGANGKTLLTRAKKGSHSKSKSTSKKAKTSAKNASKKGVTDSVLKGGLSKILDTIKAVGKPEPVTITWYTGHDLLNPSCWSNPSWAPTDDSFAAALTLEGWTTKPKCFKFLELCNTPKKCVFVRVVDSCAGCAKGSKHVDLTKGAFTQLADLDQGILTVHMRQATDPLGWLENLWGPRVKANDHD